MTLTQEQVTTLVGETLQGFGPHLPAGEDDLTPILEYAIKRATRPENEKSFSPNGVRYPIRAGADKRAEERGVEPLDLPTPYGIARIYGPPAVLEAAREASGIEMTMMLQVGAVIPFDPAEEIPEREFGARLVGIAAEIKLGMQCDIRVGHTENRGWFVQIRCWREDTITKKMGYGRGGKAYPSQHATDSEIIQMIFGLYKSYWEHEARETFIWRDRRPFGPHISTEALWEVARKVDVRSQKHEEDRA